MMTSSGLCQPQASLQPISEVQPFIGQTVIHSNNVYKDDSRHRILAYCSIKNLMIYFLSSVYFAFIHHVFHGNLGK
jgi:hypothetical protein